jgi:hypothetical protein
MVYIRKVWKKEWQKAALSRAKELWTRYRDKNSSIPLLYEQESIAKSKEDLDEFNRIAKEFNKKIT